MSYVWLYPISLTVFLAVVVLRGATARNVWSRGQATSLALASPALCAMAIVALLFIPSGVQHQSAQIADATGRIEPVAVTVTPTSYWDSAGWEGVVAAFLPLVIALMPIVRGLRPWPRGAFAVSAGVLVLFCFVTGFSIGLLFLPAAAAARGPVMIAPRYA